MIQSSLYKIILAKYQRIGHKFADKLKRDGIEGVFVAIMRYPSIIMSSFANRVMLKRALKSDSLEERFSMIYEKNLWSSKESGSGVGSEVGYTEPLRAWLVKTITNYQIEKLVDAPCGDFNWMKLVLPQVHIEYFGYDIVESVVSRNNDIYSSQKIHFGIADICKDELPKCDILIVRDCLFHFSFEDVNRFLRNIANVDYKYLLTTTYIGDEGFENRNITTGDFRQIDLFCDPFNFRTESVLERVYDSPKDDKIPRQIIMLAKSDVPQNLD
jgi:hypothetical protein